MSYHRTPRYCFPDQALLRLQPRAAGPLRFLQTLTGPYEQFPIDPDRGVLVIDPRYDNLPLGPIGWRTA